MVRQLLDTLESALTGTEGASTIQVGPVILGGRAAANQELMISRDGCEPGEARLLFEGRWPKAADAANEAAEDIGQDS